MIKKLFTLLMFVGVGVFAFAQNNVTFKVDMNKYTGSYTKVYVSGTFNSWSGDANEITDANSDGIYEGTISIASGDIEYKFTMDNWTNQEQFSGGEGCTVTNGGFTNRALTVSADVTLDVVCFNSCTECSNKKQIDLPINWDESDVDYTITPFEGAKSMLVEDPTNSSNMVVKTEKFKGAQPWAGTTMSTNGGLASVIPFDADNNLISVKVWSPDANIKVRLKAEVAGTPSQSVETDVMTTKSGEWETLVFDFSKEASGTAKINYAYKFNMLSIFFNFLVSPNDVGDKTYYFDDVKFGGAASANPMITFQVDMNDYTGTYTNVNLNGTFNNWCGACAVMTDDNSDGIYELEVELPMGEIEYKFTVDGWNDDEKFSGGESCTKTTGGFTNRVYQVSEDATLDVVCWAKCEACDAGPTTADVTFKVNMTDYTGTYTNVNLNGTFNNWCGDCALMTDDNSDGIYELKVNLPIEAEVEYKFTVDGWNDDEKFAGGEACTKTTDGFTNRVYNVTEETELDVVCWASCNDCAVGFNEMAELAFSVSPNPSNGIFNVIANSTELGSIIVYNYQGKEVMVINQTTLGTNQIDLSNEPAGIYLVKISSQNGFGFEQIIVE